MKDRRWKAWREDLVAKLEGLHMLAVEADAFQSAFETIYGNTSWPTDGDPDRRRALNRMACFVEQLNHKIGELLRESHVAVELVMKR
jgi:hypothetical protein